MQYFHEQTTIPLPRVVCYSSSSEQAGRPFVVTTKVEGIALVEVWDDLSDHRRDVILRQVVEIVVEMYSQRFEKIGCLSREGLSGPWVIEAPPSSEQQSKAFTSGTGYWIDYTTRRLATIFAEAYPRAIDYAHVWWMRSLIPSLYDDSLDVDGFPLMHGDLHSQNIFIVDADSDEPRISSIIDWDKTRTVCTSSFAQPPFFIVDHPMADPEDDKTQALVRRNARDQEVFMRLVREEEVRRFPNRPPRLSQALMNWEGVYLFEQCIGGGPMYSALWDTLVEHIVGDKNAHFEYIYALIDTGLLKSVAEELKQKKNISDALVDSRN